jgi:hypothetical protein
VPIASAPAVLFCADPMSPLRPDPAYEHEVAAAEALEIEHHLIGFEALVDERNPTRAVRRVPQYAESVLGIYRGWMLRPEQYAPLYAALGQRGVTLINDPDAYAHCHALPNWYPLLERWTPASAWTDVQGDVPTEAILGLSARFGDKPLVVKDFVKSRKHDWDDACFIPSAADGAAVERIARRFLQLQGPDLYGGLVFREFEPFEPLGTHLKSGMPLTREYRLFFLDGVPVASAEYWEEGDYGSSAPPLDEFRPIGALVRSRFFTMDVARRTDGAWRVVELGDGQVAGLPDRLDPCAFYSSFATRLRP